MSILVFVLGLIIGSFLNTVIHRSVQGGSIFAKSSICPQCRHQLAWSDLVPLLSFFLLRRKCRYCEKPISWQYPLVELATGILFVLIFYNSPPPFLPHQWGGIEGGWLTTDYLLLITRFVFACFLIVIFAIDAKHYLIFDKIVIPAAGLALLYQVWQGHIFGAILGAVLLAGFFSILYFLSHGQWIGFGDVKLGIFLGILIPWPTTLVLFFLAYFLGAVFSLGLIATRYKSLKDRVPFGTFLTTAALVAMLWGEELTNWYLHIIGIG